MEIPMTDINDPPIKSADIYIETVMENITTRSEQVVLFIRTATFSLIRKKLDKSIRA